MKAVQGTLQLGQRYGDRRLEDACRRAVAYGHFDYWALKRMLETGLDQAPLSEEAGGQLQFPFLDKESDLRDWTPTRPGTRR